MVNQEIRDLVASLAELPQVEAIALGGSHSMSMQDDLSDYDLYVYVSERIPVDIRQQLADQYCSYMEVANQFWEEEDDGVLKSGTEVEIIYRDLKWLEDELTAVVSDYRASTGYTTCFWANILNSEIVYDQNQELSRIKHQFSVSYPHQLVENIVAKNKPLLTDAMPAYIRQIKKALARQDRLSINHRIAEYFACYFDVLFAINQVPHPGEKRLVSYSLKLCNQLPEQFEESINSILTKAGASDPCLVNELEIASERLVAIINK